jgi:L-fuconolactonase
MIDTHLHPIAADLARYPLSPIDGVQSEWSRGYQLTAEEILEHMRQAAVGQATLVQASTVHGYDNTYCADCCVRYPDKFVGVCCIDPTKKDALETLNFWIEGRHMHGLRLFTIGSTLLPNGRTQLIQRRWLSDPSTFPVWERADQIGVPIDVQVSMGGLDMLREMLERFPSVRVLLGHLAGPSLADGPPYQASADLLALNQYPNLFLKFTTNTVREAAKHRSGPRPFFELLLQRFGADRLVWGSNFPATRGASAPYREIVNEVRAALAPFSDVERDWMFRGTALMLYPSLAL